MVAILQPEYGCLAAIGRVSFPIITVAVVQPEINYTGHSNVHISWWLLCPPKLKIYWYDIGLILTSMAVPMN